MAGEKGERVEPLAEFELEEIDSTLVARLRGEVDLSNVSDLRAQLVAAVSHDFDTLVLDLTETTYLDSTGVRLLFELAERLHGRRQQLHLAVADEALVRRVIVLTQLDDRVPVHRSLPEALAACAPPPSSEAQA
jgi:anti-anti-sigma factor